MDLKERKSNATEFLTHLNYEELFKQIEDIIFRSIDSKNNSFELFTSEEIVERVLKSNKDYKTGKFKPQRELEIESQS